MSFLRERKRYDDASVISQEFDSHLVVPLSAFNPYREWLGFPDAGPPTYYQLLRVSREDLANADETERIRRHAIKLIRKLKNLDVGERDEQRQRVIQRIKRAAAILSDNARRQEYDRKLDAQPTIPNKSPKAKPFDSMPKASPQPALPPRATNQDEIAPGTSPTAPPKVRDTKRSSKRSQSDDGSAPNDTQAKPSTDDSAVRYEQGKTVTSELMRLRPRGKAIAPAYHENRRRSKALMVSSILLLLCGIGIGYLVLTQSPARQWLVNLSNQDLDSPTAVNSGTSNRMSLQPESAASSPGRNPHSSTASVSMIGGSAHTGSAIDNVALSSSANRVPTNPLGSDSQVNVAQRARLVQLLAEVRVALAERNMKKAKTRLSEARAFAMEPEEKAARARLQTLAEYVAAYWKAAEDEVRKLEPGTEIVLSNRRFIVVERTASKLTLRRGGKNGSFALADLPTWLAVGLADNWFDNEAPTTKVFRGAMMAVTPGYGKDQANVLWEQAQASGEVDLGDLVRVLDEDFGKYDSATTNNDSR